MKKYHTAAPNIAVYLLVKKNNKIALLLRSHTDWMNNYYSLVAGKVENDESFTQAAVREAKEEANIEIDPKDLKHVLTVHRYEPSDQATDWVDLFFELTIWKGEVINAETHMHSELIWTDINKLPDNVIASVKFALEQIKVGKQYAEYGWEKK